MERALFSDLKAFAKLKVYIRNLNNRAAYLASLANSNYDINEIHLAIKWEIRRHIALWASVYYFHENNCIMPESAEKSIKYMTGKEYGHISDYLSDNDYYENNHIIEHGRIKVLAKELAPYNSINENIKYIDTKYKEFISDRVLKRDLLVFLNNKQKNNN